MSAAVILALSFALLATVFALYREVRFRRAFERLLRYLLSHLRRNLHEASPADSDRDQFRHDDRL